MNKRTVIKLGAAFAVGLAAGAVTTAANQPDTFCFHDPVVQASRCIPR